MYTRRDYDLCMTIEITLEEGLLGWTREITSICGQSIHLEILDVTLNPGWEERHRGFGMKRYKSDHRGDLIITTTCKWTTTFTENQKKLIRKAFEAEQ